MLPYFVWFLLFVLNLVVIPIGISPFETPKVVIAEILIDTLLFLKIIHLKRTSLKHLLSSQTLFLGIIFLLSIDQLFLFHPSFQNILGNPFRLQGLFLLWHLMIFSYISKDIRIVNINKLFYYLSFIFLFLATIILGVNQNNRAFGTLGEPNALSATALFIFPFVYLKSKWQTRAVFILFAFLIILLSGSRAGLIGFIVELLFIALISFVRTSFSKATFISLALILFTLFLPFIEGGSWFENRGTIWQTAINAGFDSPFLGRGFGNIQNSIHNSAVMLNNPVQYQVVDSAHNFILDYWIQGGIVGVISIVILIFLSLQGFIRHKKVLETMSFLGLITAMLFNPVSVVNLLAFWWLIGQGTTIDKSSYLG